MRVLSALLAAFAVSSCALAPAAVDPTSDAPEASPRSASAVGLPASYGEALGKWRSPSEINEWIGARFEYDLNRAMKLSETQREGGPRVRIYVPSQFFDRPAGVCVDLARFAVETLRNTTPAAKAVYLLIEFEPALISGNTLRRHWVVQYELDGMLYYFADSKRPGHIAGPYGDVTEYIEQYSQFRQRRIITYRTLESYERKLKMQAPKATRE